MFGSKTLQLDFICRGIYQNWSTAHKIFQAPTVVQMYFLVIARIVESKETERI
jgi:hypothetical protein